METSEPRIPTNQELFDRVWQYFVVEGNPPGLTESGGCRLRVPKTKARCAIGLLIPDKLYSWPMEAYTACSLLERNPELSIHLGEDAAFLNSLQAAHDVAAIYGRVGFQERLTRELRLRAQRFGLTVPPENDFKAQADEMADLMIQQLRENTKGAGDGDF